MRRVLVAIAASVGLASLTACGSSFTPPNLAPDGAVESLPCEHVVETINIVAAASRDQDADTLLALGVNDQNKAQVNDRLNTRQNACNSPHTVQEVKGRPNEKQVEVIANDGSHSRLPLPPNNGQVIKGDSTREPDTPPVGLPPMLERCKNSLGWDQLVECVGGDQWYKDGFTRMKPYTGFDWNDVLNWATTKDANGTLINARVVHVYGMDGYSEDQARSDVRSLIGPPIKGPDGKLVDAPVFYHHQFVNSRGLEHDRVSPFVDQKTQVRVSLAPIVRNEKGEPELAGNAGVFVDCLNIWGLPFSIAPSPEKPAPCPGTDMPVPPEGPKGCNLPPGTTTPPPPPPGCVGVKCTPQPPCEGPQCQTLTPKVRSDAPGQGGAGDGGKSLYGGDGTERHTAAATPDAPKAGQPPATQQPSPTKPSSNPVPSATKAPSPTTPLPTATGAPPSSAAPSQCVNPPGMNVCG